MDVFTLPLLFSLPYRLGLKSANEESYKMSDDELKIFLFNQTCIILSGVLAAREGQPLIIQQRFSKIYELLNEEYVKLHQ